MKKTWMSWLLFGALLASLQGHLRDWQSSQATAQAGEAAQPASCAPFEGLEGCTLDAERLGLDAEQSRRLTEVCREQCATMERRAQRADAKLAELRSGLLADELDEEHLRGLIEEIGTLRAQALGACVDALVEVRSILDPEQLGSLVAGCCTSTCETNDSCGEN